MVKYDRLRETPFRNVELESVKVRRSKSVFVGCDLLNVVFWTEARMVCLFVIYFGLIYSILRLGFASVSLRSRRLPASELNRPAPIIYKKLVNDFLEDFGEFDGIVAEAIKMWCYGDNVTSCYFDVV